MMQQPHIHLKKASLIKLLSLRFTMIICRNTFAIVCIRVLVILGLSATHASTITSGSLVRRYHGNETTCENPQNTVGYSLGECNLGISWTYIYTDCTTNPDNTITYKQLSYDSLDCTGPVDYTFSYTESSVCDNGEYYYCTSSMTPWLDIEGMKEHTEYYASPDCTGPYYEWYGYLDACSSSGSCYLSGGGTGQTICDYIPSSVPTPQATPAPTVPGATNAPTAVSTITSGSLVRRYNGNEITCENPQDTHGYSLGECYLSGSRSYIYTNCTTNPDNTITYKKFRYDSLDCTGPIDYTSSYTESSVCDNGEYYYCTSSMTPWLDIEGMKEHTEYYASPDCTGPYYEWYGYLDACSSSGSCYLSGGGTGQTICDYIPSSVPTPQATPAPTVPGATNAPTAESMITSGSLVRRYNGNEITCENPQDTYGYSLGECYLRGSRSFIYTNCTTNPDNTITYKKFRYDSLDCTGPIDYTSSYTESSVCDNGEYYYCTSSMTPWLDIEGMKEHREYYASPDCTGPYYEWYGYLDACSSSGSCYLSGGGSGQTICDYIPSSVPTPQATPAPTVPGATNAPTAASMITSGSLVRRYNGNETTCENPQDTHGYSLGECYLGISWTYIYTDCTTNPDNTITYKKFRYDSLDCTGPIDYTFSYTESSVCDNGEYYYCTSSMTPWLDIDGMKEHTEYYASPDCTGPYYEWYGYLDACSSSGSCYLSGGGTGQTICDYIPSSVPTPQATPTPTVPGATNAPTAASMITSGSLVRRYNGNETTCENPQDTHGYSLGECYLGISWTYIYTDCTTNPDNTITYKEFRYDSLDCTGPIDYTFSYTESSVCDNGEYYYCTSSMTPWLDIEGMKEHREYYASPDCTGPYYEWYGYLDACSSSGSCYLSGGGSGQTICDYIPSSVPTPQATPAPTVPGATNAPTAESMITSGSLVRRYNGNEITCENPQDTYGYSLGECYLRGSRSYIYTNCTTNPDNTITYKKFKYDSLDCTGPIDYTFSYTESSVCDNGEYYYCTSSMTPWLDIEGMKEHTEYYASPDCTGPYYEWYGYLDACSSSGSCYLSGGGSGQTICDYIPSSVPTPQATPAPTVPGATNAPTAVDVSVGYEVTKSAGGSLLNNDYSALTELAMGDDDVVMLKLPFAFTFYGKYYDHGYLSSNGLLSFANGCDGDFNDCSADIDFMSTTMFAEDAHVNDRNYDIGITASRTSRSLSNQVGDAHIVVLKRKISLSNVEELLQELRYHNQTSFTLAIDEVLYGLRMIVIRRASLQAIEFLRLHKDVLSVRRDKMVSATEIPNSRRRVTATGTYSWGLDRIDQVDLPLDNKQYKSTSSGGGKGVSVFVLDSGIDTNHVEFTTDSSREVKNVFNYFGNVTSDTDGDGHGSHCAGTIGGTNVGVAPKANIYGVKVLNDYGLGYGGSVTSGLEFVYNYRLANPKTPMVVSMSLGGDCNPADDCTQDPAIIALQELSEVGVSVVVAAGNDAEDACTTSPAMSPTAITVGASDINDEQIMYSNNGECVDIQAPGVDILSVCSSSMCDGLENQYVEMSGTSMACPHVAGIVALWLSQTGSSYSDPPSTAEIKTALQCQSIRNTLDKVRSDTLNMFVQVPDPSFDNFEQAACDTEGQCGSSDDDVCSDHGTCMYGMCVCEDSYTGDCCENEGPGYEVHYYYCCEGDDLSDSDVVGPFNALAFMWIDFHPESDGASVYFGAANEDTTVVVFENVPAFNLSCRATIEVLLHRDGDIQVAIVSNNISTGTVACDIGDATMGLKGPKPEDGDAQLYEEVYGPSDDDMPAQEIITYRPLYVVRPPSNTTAPPATCVMPTSSVPTPQATPAPTVPGATNAPTAASMITSGSLVRRYDGNETTCDNPQNTHGYSLGECYLSGSRSYIYTNCTTNPDNTITYKEFRYDSLDCTGPIDYTFSYTESSVCDNGEYYYCTSSMTPWLDIEGMKEHREYYASPDCTGPYYEWYGYLDACSSSGSCYLSGGGTGQTICDYIPSSVPTPQATPAPTVPGTTNAPTAESMITSGSLVRRYNGNETTCENPQDTHGYSLGECYLSGSRSCIYTDCTTNPDNTITYKEFRYDSLDCTGPIDYTFSYTESSVCDNGEYYYCTSSMTPWLDIEGMKEHREYYASPDCTGPYYEWYGYLDACSSSGSCYLSGGGSGQTICDYIPSSVPTPQATPAPTVPGTTNAPTAVDVSVGYEVTKSAGGSLLNNDYSALTELAMGDDDVVMLKLPFAFTFYGKYYDHGYLSSNGLLSFANGCDGDFNDCSADIDFMSTTMFAEDAHVNDRNYDIGITASRTSRSLSNQVGDAHIVVLKRKISLSNVEELLQELRYHNQTSFTLAIDEVLYGLRMIVIRRASLQAIEFLRLHKDVLSVRRDKMVSATEIPNSRRRVTATGTYSWGLDRIDQVDLPLDNKQYKSTSSGGGKGVSVFVLDSGIDTNHVEFTTDSSREVKNVFNYFGNVTSDTDGDGHGSHCAGTIGGTNVGVAPKANIYGVKVLNDYGLGYGGSVTSGLEFVYNYRLANPKTPMVVSMSLGGDCNPADDCTQDPAIIALQELSEVGVSVVVAAGNDAEDACTTSPAMSPTAITVGASDINDEQIMYSNNGECVDIQAPGVDILSVCSSSMCDGLENQYVEMSGTSMACPHVAGIVALWLSQTGSSYSDPPSTAEIKTALQCQSIRNTLDKVRSDTLNMFVQVPDPSFDNFEQAACDTEGQCGSSDDDVCSDHGTCMYGMCVCEDSYTGDCCENEGPGYEVHYYYCCEGDDLSDSDVVGPFNALAFMWIDFHPESDGASVYFGAANEDTTVVVFENVPAFNLSCRATIEVLLHRDGDIQVAIVSNNISTGTVACDIGDATMGLKGPKPEDGDAQLYEEVYGPSDDDMPAQEIITYRPLYVVRPPSNTTAPPATCVMPTSSVPTPQATPAPTVPGATNAPTAASMITSGSLVRRYDGNETTCDNPQNTHGYSLGECYLSGSRSYIYTNCTTNPDNTITYKEFRYDSLDCTGPIDYTFSYTESSVCDNGEYYYCTSSMTPWLDIEGMKEHREYYASPDCTGPYYEWYGYLDACSSSGSCYLSGGGTGQTICDYIPSSVPTPQATPAPTVPGTTNAPTAESMITSGSLVRRYNGNETTCENPQDTHGYSLGECYLSGSRSCIYTDCTTNPDNTITYKEFRYDSLDCTGPIDYTFSYTESSVCDNGEYYYCTSSMTPWLDIEGMKEHREYYASPDCTGPYYEWYGYLDACSSSGSCYLSGGGSGQTICDYIPSSVPTPQATPAPTVPGTTNAPTAVDVSVGYEVTKSAGGSLLNNDYSALTELAMGDDDVVMLKLPFAFTFYGKYYDHGYLSSNGLLSFANGCDGDFNDCSADIDFMSTTMFAEDAHVNDRNYDIGITASRTSRSLSNQVGDAHIVVLKRKISLSNVEELLQELRYHNQTSFTLAIDEVLYGLRMIVIRRASLQAIEFLRLHKDVLSVRRDKMVSATEIPNSRRRVTATGTYSWGLDRIDQVDLPLDNKQYKSTSSGGGKGVSVFVLDSGIDTNHVEFTTDSSREVKNVFNYFGNVTSDTDGDGHGSHCAGTIGGTNVGVAPKANIYGVKVLNDYGLGYGGSVTSGLEFVYNYRLANPKTPMVVSMSLGGDCNPADDCTQDPAIIALQELSEVGVSVVVAAGNDAEDACTTSPAMSPTAITVGASDINDEQIMYSNNGECVDIQAPGVDILSVCSSSMCDGLENQYVEMSGTSMACPHVAGIVALWLSQTGSSYSDPPSTAEIKTALQCQSIRNTLDKVRSDTLNMFVQVPDPSFDNFEQAACDTEGQCGSSDDDVCSDHGTCMYGMCVCEDSYTGDCCENEGPGYEVHYYYCCEGDDLSDSDVVGPFNALAFMWIDFHPESDGASVYFGAANEDTTVVVFENVPAFNLSCRATIEVLLHRDGDIQVAIVSNNISTGTVACDIGDATMGLKGPKPEDGDAQLYEEVYGPSDDDMPAQEIITYRPLYVVRPPSNTTAPPATCVMPTPTKNKSNDDDETSINTAVIVAVPIAAVILLLASGVGVMYYRRKMDAGYDDEAVKAREKMSASNPLQLL